MRVFCVAVLMCLTAAVSFAQVPTPTFFAPDSDLYVGYTMTLPDYGGHFYSNRINGAEVGYEKNFRPHFSVAAMGVMVFGGTYDVKQFSGTVGPKVNLLTGRFRPYITAQAGFAYQDSHRMYAADHHPPLQGTNDVERGFTYRVGGGLDVQVNHKVYWRVGQWDLQPQPWGRHKPFYQNWGTGLGYRF